MTIEEAIKQSQFDNSYQKALVNIIYTSNWLRDQQEDLFKEYGILPQHFNILKIVNGKSPNAISPGEIKEVMLDKGNDVTRLVDKLVSKGFVKRTTCADNRRKIDIQITKLGKEFLKKMNAPFKKHIISFKNNMSEKEAELLSNLLDKLRN